jgi:uncharacterized protein
MSAVRSIASMRLRRSKKSDLGRSAATANIYYASDLHGSERLWRKFLKAGDFYQVDSLIMGGDLIGKAIVPIVKAEDGSYGTQFLGEQRVARSEPELEELMASIRYNGMYPWVATPDEVAEHERNDEKRHKLFDDVIAAEMRHWVALADERLGGRPVDAYVIAGNDDPWFVDDIIRESKTITPCEGTIVMVGRHELLSSSYANRTPWDSHRELDESELYAQLKSIADQLENPHSAIFNLHVPPFDSGLDMATEIDSELRVVTSGGQTSTMPVGSTAVRQIIEEFQPALALHGHIHESRAASHIGRTLALNSGSEYTTGRIHGAVVRLRDDDVLSQQFVVG